MYEDFMLNNAVGISDIDTVEPKETNLDSLFNNLTQDIENVNKYILDVSKKKKTNDEDAIKLEEERQNLEKQKEEFESYCKIREIELNNIQAENERQMVLQQEKLRKAEEDFRSSMSTSLSELELEKKSLEIQREELKQEKEQFERYKEVSEKKIELDTKSLEQKCLKFKEIINQFNDSFEMKLDEE